MIHDREDCDNETADKEHNSTLQVGQLVIKYCVFAVSINVQ